MNFQVSCSLLSKVILNSRFHVNFPTVRRLKRADSMYVYHYTLAFEPDFALEQRSTLNSECPS